MMWCDVKWEKHTNTAMYTYFTLEKPLTLHTNAYTRKRNATIHRIIHTESECVDLMFWCMSETSTISLCWVGFCVYVIIEYVDGCVRLNVRLNVILNILNTHTSTADNFDTLAHNQLKCWCVAHHIKKQIHHTHTIVHTSQNPLILLQMCWKRRTWISYSRTVASARTSR